MKPLTTLFLLLLTIPQSYAAGTIVRTTENEVKEYDVEVIIFEDAHARYLNSELWPQTITGETGVQQDTDSSDSHTIIVTPLTDELASDTTRQVKRSFKNIKPGILSSEYARLNRSSEYNVLFYGAWRQQGLEKSDAFDIDLNELNNAARSNTANTISGHFKVELARYLHFYSDLEYHRKPVLNPVSVKENMTELSNNRAEDVNNPDVSAVNTNNFPMSNHVRMRSKELHYIDHPLVGMLVQINPVEKTDSGN